MTKWKIQKKYIKIALIALGVIILALFFSYMLEHQEQVKDWTKVMKHAIFPIMAGSILAYLLNPILNFFERNLFAPLGNKIFKKNEKKGKKFSRVCGITCTLVVFFVMLVGGIYMVAPQVYQSVVKIVTEAPTYYENVNGWINDISKDNPELGRYLVPALDRIYNQALTYVNEDILPNMDKIVAGVTSGIVGGVKMLLNVVVAVIVSVYVMSEKEILISVFKKLTYSLFSVKDANAVVRGARYANQVFGGFINGKIIDSFIIGVLCYIFMVCVDFHYPVLISMIIGVTNVIPYFGPFIGAIPSILILLMMDFKQGLIFGIFVLVLQQIDGNIIGPLILGDRLKISSMWILFAILIGGGFFGIPGMILGAPCFACIYAMVSTFCKVKLEQKELPLTTADYLLIDQISIEKEVEQESEEKAE
ncbi:MAG: AI-2E family transporter [Lachnospiraceae bacterium]|nr:AI-2E family transporter [Lachnospiraceae bacterium]